MTCLSECRIITQVVLLLILNGVVGSLQVRNVNASMDKVYNFSIVKGNKHILVYESGGSDTQSFYEARSASNINHRYNALKVICSAQYEYHYDIECPLILTVTQKSSVVFWKIVPLTYYPNSLGRNVTMFSNTERTICLEDSSHEDEMMTVEISTCSKSRIRYTVSVQLRNDLLISLNMPIKSQLTPTSPVVYFFPPLTNLKELLFLQLTSMTESCMIMSFQKPSCPIRDTVETIMNHGQWQTVSVKTGITIPIEEFPTGFFIVFLLLPDDSWCNHSSLGQPEIGTIFTQALEPITQTRGKTIHFVIRTETPTTEYHIAIFIPLGLFLIFISIIFLIHLHFHRIRCQFSNCGTLSSSSTPVGERFETLNLSHQCAITMGSTDSIFRSRIQISELINSHPVERLMVQSKRYYMAGILVASFYCVPVFQLILSYHRRLRETGNVDLCYFNFMCSHTLGVFNDFNHIYSNIGYLICGPVFMIIVYLRQATSETDKNLHSRRTSLSERRIVEKGDLGGIHSGNNKWLPRATWDISKGVFVHHGLFYAMGFSLFMTGVMSGAYHICPNQNNFQFDTAFMYTIAALGVVTIYQFRHPTYVSASMTFLVLALVAASTVVGLLWESLKFRLFFTVTHITFLLMILIYIHYVGYIRVDGVTVTEWRKMLSILRQKWIDDIKNCRLLSLQRNVWSPRGVPGTVVLPGPCRLIFPIVVVGVNFGALAMIWTMMSTTNFASQVLAVYVINCSVYSVYYSVMKMLHNECRGKLWFQPAIYLVISTVLWTWSLSYFGDEVTLWERSPAESRAKNAECVLLGFYDSHDIWHLMSAGALFTSLMSLLTMDDDLIERPKSEIPVF